MSDGKLAGKVAIVTGAASGIGKGIALKFAQEGAEVVIDYIGDDSSAADVAKQIQALGRKAIIFAADVSKPEETMKLVDAAWDHFGKADILVNNAGVEKSAPFQDVSEKDYDLVLDINLKGPFFTSQAFVKRLLAAKMPGCIVNMSSVHEDMVFPHFSTYCAAKGGLRMLMRDMAVELGPQNIRVNNIAPGAVDTPINAKMMSDAPELKALLANIPLGRMGLVDNIADLAVFLASDAASYVTGSTYVIDGGLMRSYHEQ